MTWCLLLWLVFHHPVCVLSQRPCGLLTTGLDDRICSVYTARYVASTVGMKCRAVLSSLDYPRQGEERQRKSSRTRSGSLPPSPAHGERARRYRCLRRLSRRNIGSTWRDLTIIPTV
ncbi:unnamed protein product, partial [Ectocarpus sp. 12 AP-2014]